MGLYNFDGIIISHLGNISGRNVARENTLSYVKEALAAGFHVCIDVVFANESFLLPGPDDTFAPIPPAFLSNQKIWCRACTPTTLNALCDLNVHTIPFATDSVVLTSAQFLWSLPPAVLTPRSIATFPEFADANWCADADFDFAGVCTNHPEDWRC